MAQKVAKNSASLGRFLPEDLLMPFRIPGKRFERKKRPDFIRVVNQINKIDVARLDSLCGNKSVRGPNISIRLISPNVRTFLQA